MIHREKAERRLRVRYGTLRVEEDDDERDG